MKIVTRFAGTNREFRAYLAAQMYHGKVVSLAEYRGKRKAVSKRAAKPKLSDPSIA